jgi:LysR family transcriptional regulator, glycine cleavage system transcriptional activator
VLAACVRHGSFSRAARELGITPTAVSQRMRALECRLGGELFRRRGPRLTTTPRALALGQTVDHALSMVRVAVDNFRRVKEPLRVTCAPTFAARWLIPRLATYHTLPGANAIALDAAQTLLPHGAFDIAIRSGAGPWEGYQAIRLLSERRTPMLSPKWIPRDGRFTVRDLVKVPLIPDPTWPAWLKLAGVGRARPGFVATRFPNYELEAQAAVRGVGAALLSPVLFAELTARGDLIAPFRCVVEGPASYWLLTTPRFFGTHFATWIRAQFDAPVESVRSSSAM